MQGIEVDTEWLCFYAKCDWVQLRCIVLMDQHGAALKGSDV